MSGKSAENSFLQDQILRLFGTINICKGMAKMYCQSLQAVLRSAILTCMTFRTFELK